jgi:N-acetylglutamate synthase-like GNAT family acetyltransferase
MINIVDAKPEDREAIEVLIQMHPDYLQQDPLLPWSDFSVLKVFGKTHGCCGLKVYSKKFAEIRSLAFSAWWWRVLFALALVTRCINRAKQQSVRQLLVTLSKQYRLVFRLLGFSRFNKEKYALLKRISGLKPLALVELPGVNIRRAFKEERLIIMKLVENRTEILHDSRFFPDWQDFYVALVDGAIVGCCALVVFLLHLGDVPEMAEIRTLFVIPEQNGQGIGRELAARVYNWAIELKVAELLAITGEAQKPWFVKHFQLDTQRAAEEAWLKVLDN